ncbi:hypothetical protein MMC06_003857 [Schaereria dolodes]|nr:hypothetical protein [Schaereria dolodes]
MSQSHPRVQSSTDSMVYLVSSPSGPHGLLISPSGVYSTTSAHSTQLSVMGPGFRMNLSTSQHPNTVIPDRAVNPPQNPNAHAPANAAQAGQIVQQQPPPDPARDVLRILLPLGGHLWLLVRLFGFVYFFTSGAGWRRTILLGICAIIVFISQTAIFRPLQQAIWNPIRRHVEGLVPLANNDRPIRLPAVERGDAVRERPNGSPGPHDQSRPRNTADQGADRRDGSVIQASLRRVERAIALFVASLVPGVGERHIAARDAAEAAEAAREAEAREREEQERRDADVARQREERGTREVVAEGENADIAPDVAEQDSSPPPQAPLIEI